MPVFNPHLILEVKLLTMSEVDKYREIRKALIRQDIIYKAWFQ